MAKIEIDHKEKNQFPCFGINKYSIGILVVEFEAERTGKVILDTRPNPPYIVGSVHSENWTTLENWDIVTKEFSLKFTV